jgi:hypothetical protein
VQGLTRQAALKYTVGGVSQTWRPLAVRTFIVDHLLGFQISRYSNSLDEQTKRAKNWTNEVNKNAKEMLREGCQVWEIARRLRRSELSVQRKLPNDEAMRVLLRPKKGGFGSNEVAYMEGLWKQGLDPPAFAKRLGRMTSTVRQQLFRLADKICNGDQPSVFQGSQALQPEDIEFIIQYRLQRLWDGLLRLDMTDSWKKVLSPKQAETWLPISAKGIPTQVKQLLAHHEFPTVAKLEALPWIETQNAGVYGWLLTPKKKPYLDKHCHLYVGSGSKRGIEGRRQDHLSESPYIHNQRLRQLIKDKKSKPEGHFITLMIVETNSAEDEDTIGVRYLVTLAEAILTAWLGSLRNSPTYAGDSSHLCPWGRDEVSYSGCSSHNPLTMDINVPGKLQSDVRSPSPLQ